MALPKFYEWWDDDEKFPIIARMNKRDLNVPGFENFEASKGTMQLQQVTFRKILTLNDIAVYREERHTGIFKKFLKTFQRRNPQTIIVVCDVLTSRFMGFLTRAGFGPLSQDQEYKNDCKCCHCTHRPYKVHSCYYVPQIPILKGSMR